MAVTAGRDYAFSPFLRTVLKGAGVTRACALVTRQALYVLPSGSPREPLTLQGKHPTDVVVHLLNDPQMTPAQLDGAVTACCQGLSGSVLHPLAQFRRIKIRTGFFGRAVRMTDRPDGIWGNPFVENFGWRPAKDDLPAFTAFFAGDPRLV